MCCSVDFLPYSRIFIRIKEKVDLSVLSEETREGLTRVADGELEKFTIPVRSANFCATSFPSYSYFVPVLYFPFFHSYSSFAGTKRQRGEEKVAFCNKNFLSFPEQQHRGERRPESARDRSKEKHERFACYQVSAAFLESLVLENLDSTHKIRDFQVLLPEIV